MNINTEIEEMRLLEEEYLAEQEYIEWCHWVEDVAYNEVIMPEYFAELDAYEAA